VFRLIRLFHTSIGQKIMMALTGLLLLAFLTGHMLGNLKVFQGPQALNDYAAWLQGHPFLWVFRVSMLAIFGLHVYAAARLARANRAARPARYSHEATVQVGLPARFMLLSGVLVLSFLIFHLLHLTVGVVDPETSQVLDTSGEPDVYARVVLGFRQPWIAASYLTALALLGLHLNHAVKSLFQTLGVNHENYQALVDFFAPALTVILVTGFASVPVLSWLGIIGLAGG